MGLQDETLLQLPHGHKRPGVPEPDARAQASPRSAVRHQIWGPIEIEPDSSESPSPSSRGSSGSLRVEELLRSRSVMLRDESPAERDPPVRKVVGRTPSTSTSRERPPTWVPAPPEGPRWGLSAPACPPPWPAGGHHDPGRRAQAPGQGGAGRGGPRGGASDQEENDGACGLADGEVPYLLPVELVSAWSVGSEKHATGNCRVCHYFHTKAGCNNGANCTFCHLIHTRRRPKSRPCKSRRVKCKGMAESLDEVWEQDPEKAQEMASELLNRGNGYLRKVVQSKMRQLHDGEAPTPPDDVGGA